MKESFLAYKVCAYYGCSLKLLHSIEVAFLYAFTGNSFIVSVRG